MKMSEWRAERNRLALARLNRALPKIFPAPARIHALQRSFTPAMPRHAVDSYWRAHPVRADRLARALAAKSGAPDGWTWRLGAEPGLAATFRSPPAPYREPAFSRGPGSCCVCGQPVYRFGWHADLWGAGPNRNAAWHTACVAAWKFWNAPSDQVAPAQAAAGAALRRDRPAPVEDRRGRPSRAAVSGLARAPRYGRGRRCSASGACPICR